MKDGGATCVIDVRYVPGKTAIPHPKDPGKTAPTKQVFTNHIKYLTYRDGSLRRAAYLAGIPYREMDPALSDQDLKAANKERWIDRGMGATPREIVKHAFDLGDETVLARTWVVSPDPALMMYVDEDQRPALVAAVTEAAVEGLHDRYGWQGAEYSYVIHQRETIEEGLPHVHAHVISAGTYPIPVTGERVGASHRRWGERRYFIGKEHLAAMRESAQRAFHIELAHVLGIEETRTLLADRGIEAPELDDLYPYEFPVPGRAPEGGIDLEVE